MLPALKGFDPLYYFDIDVKGLPEHEVAQIRHKISEKLSEYILFKLANRLTDEQQLVIFQIQDGEELLRILGNYIPNLEEDILVEIENYKKAFLKQN